MRAKEGRSTENNKTYKLKCRIRKEGVTVFLEGKQLMTSPPYNELGIHQAYRTEPRDAITIGTVESGWTMSRIMLTPVKGKGRVLK